MDVQFSESLVQAVGRLFGYQSSMYSRAAIGDLMVVSLMRQHEHEPWSALDVLTACDSAGSYQAGMANLYRKAKMTTSVGPLIDAAVSESDKQLSGKYGRCSCGYSYFSVDNAWEVVFACIACGSVYGSAY